MKNKNPVQPVMDQKTISWREILALALLLLVSLGGIVYFFTASVS